MPKIVFLLLTILFFTVKTLAVTLVQQTTSYSNNLAVWNVIQELGNNLSGTVNTFTFRVSTEKTNLQQFDFTALNTRIYDKDNANFSITACTPSGSSSDPLAGLTFTTSGVPGGYQDVTVDFSCRNYSFIPGHRYLIQISNATKASSGGKRIYFASVSYGTSGQDHFNGGGLRYSFDNGSCNPSSYTWNSQNNNSGCIVWTTTKDDLYFVLSNTDPEPTPTPAPVIFKNPVIFIPGIGGSELKASQDIIWSATNGHGGTFSHAYSTGEKIWVNQDEAAKLGDDDYFDVLRLKMDGITSEAPISLTGNLASFGYPDIDSFFQGLGYTKGTDFFIFPYDWRKDVRTTKDSLDSLIEEVKQKSGKSQVNIVAHSMGGLVARYYILDTERAKKVGKLIELGVPHLGAVYALKTLRYGTWLARDLYLFKIGIVPAEVKDAFQNLPSAFQLLPSNKYYDFYNNSDKNLPYPFDDGRDIDNNKTTGILNFDQIKTLLTNLAHNMTAFTFGEQFHNAVDSKLDQSNGVKIYLIAGTGQPTLGQINETWWITWPVSLIPRTEEIFINGDETVPLYSASLKKDSLDLSGAEKIYYVEQTHGNLVSKNGAAMQTVKSILEKTDLPVEVKSEKFDLEGQHILLDDGELELYDEVGNHTGIKEDGEIETNIPETFYSTSGKTKHAFVKKKANKVKVKTTRKKKTSSDPKTTNLKIRIYKQDKISKTTTYRNLSITETAKVEFDLDPVIETAPTLALFSDLTKTESTSITSTSEVSGSPALDQTPPATKIETSGTNPITVTLTGSDADSGILKIEYSLDNGQTVQIYTGPFIISTEGKTTLQVKSIDKLGNEEIPQEKIVEITSSANSSNSNSNSSSNNTSDGGSVNEVKADSSEVRKTSADVLGINFPNPEKIAKQVEGVSFAPKTEKNTNSLMSQVAQHLGGLLIVAIGLQGMLPVFSSALMFFKPTPK